MQTIKEGLNKAYKEAGQNAYFENGFKSGVEFAQRWIPVSEELPKEGQEIICKNGNYKTVHFYYPNGVVDEDFLKANYTHWRPIEYPLL